MAEQFDILVVGAGAAGMPAAIFASRAGARVLVVEAADKLGGTFHLSSGQMSAAGTRVQTAKGIHDTPQKHFDDIMRISRNTANPGIVRLAVDNAADTLHWLLDNGFEPLPEHPVVHFGHEPYSLPRTYWGKDEGRGVLNVILPQYEAETRTGGITTWLETELVRLMQDNGGAVTGAILHRGGEEVAVTADSVILATGGYSANTAMFPELSAGQKLNGGGYPYSQGTGLTVAVQAGAEIINKDKFLPSFAAVEDPDARGGSTISTITTPQFRQPWEIYVDVTGGRFMREDDPSVDRRERALLAQPDMTFWVIYDEAIRRSAPSFFANLPAETVMGRFGNLPGYQRADTLAELARLTGMDAAKLAQTIETYNAAAASGAPDPTGREHRPLPIAEAPFYAVRHIGWSIVGFAGLKVDDNLRVLDRSGAPIPNLYAAGEILGLGATSGNAFVGGMSVTPAMTFGRLLGARLAKSAKAALAAE
jgi:fumarate reductase flavoprotein subunit